MPGKLVLVRHGQSTWNLENLFTGWTDVDLTAQGREEARAAGALLREQGFEFGQAFTSVLKRAIRTLWIILDEMDLMWIPVERDWRLNERHYGALQGLDKAETAAKYGAEQVKVWRRSYDIPPPPLAADDPRHPRFDARYRGIDPARLPATESLKDTLARVQPWWRERLAPALGAGRDVLVVAHGNSLRALVKMLDGMSDAEIVEFNIPTGVPILYELDGKQRPASPRRFLGDAAAIEAAARAVAAQAEAALGRPDSFLGRDLDLEARERRLERDLAGQPRSARPEALELLEDFLLVALHRRQLVEPGLRDIDVAGRAGAHAAADRGDAVIEFAQRLHEAHALARIHAMHAAVAIGDGDLGHGSRILREAPVALQPLRRRAARQAATVLPGSGSSPSSAATAFQPNQRQSNIQPERGDALPQFRGRRRRSRRRAPRPGAPVDRVVTDAGRKVRSRVARPRVLPVDREEPRAIVEEIPVMQVVMAGHQPGGRRQRSTAQRKFPLQPQGEASGAAAATRSR